MVADVILGNNIDTLLWIENLKENSHENIIVIDYDQVIDVKKICDITYLSRNHAQKFLVKFDTIFYYKSLYIYPILHKHKSFRKN